MAIFRKQSIKQPEPVKCICENMKSAYIDTHNTVYRSIEYDGMALHENYGKWSLEFIGDMDKVIEIFYCPLCGRRLNHWDWANDRRIENLKKYAGGTE